MSPRASRTVAVLDVGKTNVKLLLHDAATGADEMVRSAPNLARRAGPYPHADVEAIHDLLLDGLAELARRRDTRPEALTVTAHGAAGALVGDGGLALPVLDYEHDGPEVVREAYDAARPPFAETCSPRLPNGLNLGAQLFWQARAFPDAFARARHLLTYPQYWAWRLTGVAAAEPTSLGAHTDLWDPRRGRPSRLPATLGLPLAPLRTPFDVLGPLKAEIATRVGFGQPLPVLCGIHDSNASLLPHLQVRAAPFTVVSTGTWAIAFAVGGSLDRLDPERDALANVDAFGRPTPSARFMGGREFDVMVAGRPEMPDRATVASVIGRGVMAWPTFAPGNGPFPRGLGRWSHDPETLSAPERTAAASLYAALMTAACLDLLDARGPTVVEGPFGRNALMLAALADVTGRPVLRAQGATGTGAGAARLALAEAPAPAVAAAGDDFGLAGALGAYAAAWRRGAGA